MRYIIGLLFLLLILPQATTASGAEPLMDESVTGQGAMGQPGENPERLEYYIEGKQTVEGVIQDVDQAASRMTIKTQSGELPFVFDKDTRFRVGLRPGDIEDALPGLKMAGLYVEDGGNKRLVRVMVLKDMPPPKHKHKKHSSRKKKSTKKKSTKKKTKKTK